MTSRWMAKGVGDAALGERAAHGARYAEIGEGLLGHWECSLRHCGPRTIREATADPNRRGRDPSKLPRG